MKSLIRKVEQKDAAQIWELVRQSPPLDLNSPYAYLLLCHHFNDTCRVIENNGRISGFVSAYRPPSRQDVLFVWQVAVAPELRGKGAALSMLQKLLEDDVCESVKFVEATVSPSNTASRKLFRALARILNTECRENTLFEAGCFPASEKHEPEDVFRIGPIQR